MYILSSIRPFMPWSHSSHEDASDASDEENNSGVEESVEDNSSVKEMDGERRFSKAEILYTTLGLLSFSGTAYGAGFGTSEAVHHSKTNNAAGIYEQLEDPAEVSLLAI